LIPALAERNFAHWAGDCVSVQANRRRVMGQTCGSV